MASFFAKNQGIFWNKNHNHKEEVKVKLLGMYKNGNVKTTIFDDGTKIRETEDEKFQFDFAESEDIKISNVCSMNCPMCHEGSTPDGKHGDIMNEKFIDTLHPFQEVALGGGNVLEHPDLIPFLQKLKTLKIIANITVNQVHFEQSIDLIDRLVNEKLVYGIGVSLVNPTYEFIKLVKKYQNVVIHTINGILSESDVERLSGNGLKMLILGYKQLRRGSDYFEKENDQILQKQKWLYDHLEELPNKFKVVSFDNLAIAQLDVKRILSDEEWNEFYQGGDGTSTFYIDMVDRKFAKSSTATFDKRYELLDNVDDMFHKILEEN